MTDSPQSDTELYGRTFACECGKTHSILPQRVVYAADALDQLPGLLNAFGDGRTAVVLMDARTREAAGGKATETLERNGWDVAEVLLPDLAHGSPVCSDTTHDELLRDTPSADVVVSLGSGTLCDLGKWLAGDRKVPSVCFATAASMNGYSSPVIAAAIKGVKSVVYRDPPRLILSDPAVLRDAPFEMTASGLGDIVAKAASVVDWRVNHLLFDDYYCERAASIINHLEPLYIDNPEGVGQRDPSSMEALFRALLLTGVAMSMAGTSAPASGGEHLVSHTLDMIALRDATPHDLHGRQVGIGTILACAVYERLLALECPSFSHTETSADKAYWGTLNDQVEAEFSGKQERLRVAAQSLGRGDAWDRLREALGRLVRPPEQIRDCLKRAGAACTARDIGCSRERLVQAFVHAREMRSRFCVFDLAALADILPAAAEELVEQWC